MYTSLTLFIDRYADTIFFGWRIPTAWFSAIEPILLIMIVPHLNSLIDALKKKNFIIAQQNQTIFGLIITGIAFTLFAHIAYYLDNKIITVLLLVCGYGLLAIGEICIIPVTLSLTNRLSPKGYKGTLMGFF